MRSPSFLDSAKSDRSKATSWDLHEFATPLPDLRCQIRGIEHAESFDFRPLSYIDLSRQKKKRTFEPAQLRGPSGAVPGPPRIRGKRNSPIIRLRILGFGEKNLRDKPACCPIARWNIHIVHLVKQTFRNSFFNTCETSIRFLQMVRII